MELKMLPLRCSWHCKMMREIDADTKPHPGGNTLDLLLPWRHHIQLERCGDLQINLLLAISNFPHWSQHSDPAIAFS